ncbi:MAG: hypothetical protein ACRC10_09505, partial [Thermoguttaceae bacterium]
IAIANYFEGQALSMNSFVSTTNGRKTDSRSRGPEAKKTKEVAQWLGDFLKDGPVAATEITEAVKKAGYKDAVLRNAKKVLGIQSKKTSDGWIWRLPITATPAVFLRKNVSNTQETGVSW